MTNMIDDKTKMQISVVASILYKYCIEYKEYIWFSKLVDKCPIEFERSDVSKAEDYLIDLGFIETKWANVDKHWTRIYTIPEMWLAHEAYKCLIQ